VSVPPRKPSSLIFRLPIAAVIMRNSPRRSPDGTRKFLGTCSTTLEQRADTMTLDCFNRLERLVHEVC
jgi:hypothetical protein